MSKWQKFDYEDRLTWPPEGMYWTLISGDSEYVDGHKIYDFPDYTILGRFGLDEDGELLFHGEHDEEKETIIAIYPVPVEDPPEVDCFP